MTKRILVTGGGGFIGSHACERFAGQGHEVIAFDNLSRFALLGREDTHGDYNWEFLGRFPNVRRVKGDVRDLAAVLGVMPAVDWVIHTAAQTAVTSSLQEPQVDFQTNLVGTFNVLEAARQTRPSPAVVFCSTNKVYGSNVNGLPLEEGSARYSLAPPYDRGVPEDLGVDLCEHTPYGCSKLAGDLYAQDYARVFGLRVGVFRMSCIYGTRQFGVEDQGWVAWIVRAALTGRPITIYGDGKQVRDVLWVTDLLDAFERFLRSDLPGAVFNIGGGSAHTLSVIELIRFLEEALGQDIPYRHDGWRHSDQRVYISDLTRILKSLGWAPTVGVRQGLTQMLQWMRSEEIGL